MAGAAELGAAGADEDAEHKTTLWASPLRASYGGGDPGVPETKGFRCPHEGCTKWARMKSNIQSHYRVHTDEMPYVCDFEGCDETFRWRSSLNNHRVKKMS